jgi:Ca2+-binding RTX toxin-like protein
MRSRRFGLIATGLSLATLTAAPVVASPEDAPRCLGRVATIVGTPHVDTIRGTPGSDVIVGGGGGAAGRRGDKIFGLGGDDLICDNATQPVASDLRGGPGNDKIKASGIMHGGPGNDTLVDPRPVYLDVWLDAGKGNDVLRSEAEDVSFLSPGRGNDTVVGASASGSLNELVFALTGHAVLVDLRRGTANGQGHDVLRRINDVYGTARADVILGNGAANDLYGRGGDDLVAGRTGNDFLIGKTGADRLDGGRGNDYLSGDKGSDALLGRRGDDHLTERRGRQANLILAGPGTDRCTGGYQVPPNIERGCEHH